MTLDHVGYLFFTKKFDAVPHPHTRPPPPPHLTSRPCTCRVAKASTTRRVDAAKVAICPAVAAGWLSIGGTGDLGRCGLVGGCASKCAWEAREGGVSGRRMGRAEGCQRPAAGPLGGRARANHWLHAGLPWAPAVRGQSWQGGRRGPKWATFTGLAGLGSDGTLAGKDIC